MSINGIRQYLELCLKGKKTIQDRKEILNAKLCELEHKKEEIENSIDYINKKQKNYDDVLSGKTEYYSNLVQKNNDI